jgi:hypothetical protein
MRLNWNPPKIKEMRSHHTSEADHTATVVFGGYRPDGTSMPARDFFSDAIARTDFSLGNGGIEPEFIDLNERLHESIKESISDEKWEWDKTTYRRNGEVVDSPRNIIDTGELLNSQSWEAID